MPASEDRRNAMLDLARRWREDGRSARAFAQEHGVTPWALYYWRERLPNEERPARRRPHRSRPKRTKLVPVRIMPEDAGGTLELILTNGDRVRASGDVAVDTLRRVVEVLRTTC
jgi:hypothetical protein